MKRVRITQKARTPLLHGLSVFDDGEEVCRLKFDETQTVEISPGAELIQIRHLGSVATPHSLSAIDHGDHLLIVRDEVTSSYFNGLMLPFTFQKVV